ncbi:MAG: hypothetical protein ACRD9W_22560, partial [Terriglobia bacterium]
MTDKFRKHLDQLKDALLSLNPTGEKGFEGLVGAALSQITGVPFRLASSGRQFGVDGKPAYEDDSICFEAKRYDHSINRESVLAKIADLARNNDHPDLIWVLAATTPISSQLADEVRSDGAKDGIVVRILDWSESDLPPLAAALAMGGQRVLDFLSASIANPSLRDQAIEALGAIVQRPDFHGHATRIQLEFNATSAASAPARQANNEWLTAVFSSRPKALYSLGQPLAPNAAPILLDRPDILARLGQVLVNHPHARCTFVIGDEGCGKSWVVAQSWLRNQTKPMMLVIGAEAFATLTDAQHLERLVIEKIIEQSGAQPTEKVFKRWNRRIEKWKNAPLTTSPRLVVLVDGINQRPSFDWGRI